MSDLNNEDASRTQAILNEYERLHNYSTSASATIKTLTLSIGLGLSSAIIATSKDVLIAGSAPERVLFIFSFLVPAILIFTVFLWLGELSRMARIGNYLLKREIEINHLLGSDSLGWERFLRQRANRSASWVDLFAIATLLLIALGSSIFGYTLSSSLLSEKHRTLILVSSILGYVLVWPIIAVLLASLKRRFEVVDPSPDRSYLKRISSLSVVIPALNEAESLAHVLPSLLRRANEYVADVEIIVADDGSSDNTNKIISQLQCKYSFLVYIRSSEQRGIGSAIRDGIVKSTKEYVLILDADGQYEIDSLAQIASFLDITESIFPYRSQRSANIWRLLISHAANLLISNMGLAKGRDVFCGVKFFRRDLVDPRKLISRSSLINVELYSFIQDHNAYMIHQFPIDPNERQWGRSKAIGIRQLWAAFHDLYKLTNKKKHRPRR
jgi:hypothetical protein